MLSTGLFTGVPIWGCYCHILPDKYSLKWKIWSMVLIYSCSSRRIFVVCQQFDTCFKFWTHGKRNLKFASILFCDYLCIEMLFFTFIFKFSILRHYYCELLYAKKLYKRQASLQSFRFIQSKQISYNFCNVLHQSQRIKLTITYFCLTSTETP